MQREMEEDWCVSGEPEMTLRQDHEANVAILAGSHEIPCFRWNILPEANNQWTAGKGICERGAETASNASCTRTDRAPWKTRKVTKGSAAVLVAGNLCRCQRLGENVQAVWEESASTVWWTPEKPDLSHLWQGVGIDIPYMPQTENRYHLLEIAREYLRGCVEAWPLNKGTLEKVAVFFYEEVICRIGLL